MGIKQMEASHFFRLTGNTPVESELFVSAAKGPDGQVVSIKRAAEGSW